jgi:hypothetical protein
VARARRDHAFEQRIGCRELQTQLGAARPPHQHEASTGELGAAEQPARCPFEVLERNALEHARQLAVIEIGEREARDAFPRQRVRRVSMRQPAGGTAQDDHAHVGRARSAWNVQVPFEARFVERDNAR